MLDKAPVRKYGQSDKDGKCPVTAILIHDVHDDKGLSIKDDMLVHGVVTGNLERMQSFAEADSIFAQTQRRVNEIAHDRDEASRLGRRQVALPESPEATRNFLMQRLDQGATKETCRELLATIWAANESWPEAFPFAEGDRMGVRALLELMVVLGEGIEFGRMKEKAQARLQLWWQHNNLVFFDHYPEAALKLFLLGAEESSAVHLPLEELRWTLQSTREDLLALKYRYVDRAKGHWGYEHWQQWVDPFNATVQKANEIPQLAVKRAEQLVEEARADTETLVRQPRGSVTGKASKQVHDRLAEAKERLAQKEAELRDYLPIEELRITTLEGLRDQVDGTPMRRSTGRGSATDSPVVEPTIVTNVLTHLDKHLTDADTVLRSCGIQPGSLTGGAPHVP